MEWLLNEYRISVWGDERDLEIVIMIVHVGYMINFIDLYTLKWFNMLGVGESSVAKSTH